MNSHCPNILGDIFGNGENQIRLSIQYVVVSLHQNLCFIGGFAVILSVSTIILHYLTF